MGRALQLEEPQKEGMGTEGDMQVYGKFVQV